MICPEGHATDATDKLPGLEGVTVHRCKICRKFTIAGSNQWVSGGAGIADRLKELAGYEPAKQEVDEWEHLQNSDIREPIWNQTGWME